MRALMVTKDGLKAWIQIGYDRPPFPRELRTAVYQPIAICNPNEVPDCTVETRKYYLFEYGQDQYGPYPVYREY